MLTSKSTKFPLEERERGGGGRITKIDYLDMNLPLNEVHEKEKKTMTQLMGGGGGGGNPTMTRN